MGMMRDRVQRHFPMVLLTLLSIVQALALELLWEHIQNAGGLMEITTSSVVEWAQIIVTLMGIILIWVAYASNTMRFSWVPSTADSVYPFLIGLLEFVQIQLIGAETIGHWAIVMGVIFGAMVLVSHFTIRRARLSGDNGDFFEDSEPAMLSDFYPHIVLIATLLVGGVCVLNKIGAPWLDSLLLLLSFVVLVWQYVSAASFWNSSLEK